MGGTVLQERVALWWGHAPRPRCRGVACLPRVCICPSPLSPVWAAQASTFQMAILLQYNTEDAYAVQQLTDSTQIKMVPWRGEAAGVFVTLYLSLTQKMCWGEGSRILGGPQSASGEGGLEQARRGVGYRVGGMAGRSLEGSHPLPGTSSLRRFSRASASTPKDSRPSWPTAFPQSCGRSVTTHHDLPSVEFRVTAPCEVTFPRALCKRPIQPGATCCSRSFDPSFTTPRQSCAYC